MDSCEHDGCIVVWDTSKFIQCPLCNAEKEIEELQNEVRMLEEN